jgi:hypothetical protein
MTPVTTAPLAWKPLALKAAPFLAVALGALAIRTPLAAHYPKTCALLFLWLCADAAMLPLVARARRDGIDARAAVSLLAAALLGATIAMPAPMREALLAMPLAGAGIGAILAGHIAWGLARARASFAGDAPLGERVEDALAQLLPRPLVRFASAELSLLHLALFRWGAAPDVPAGQRPFAYHAHLVPIFRVVLALQVAEIAVVHVLVGLWSPTAALILFLLSDLALIYLVGLLKSFRLRPVLASDTGVRVRTGILIERHVAWDDIAAVRTAFDSAEIRRAGTEDAALLAWPNILIQFKSPRPAPSLLRPGRTRDAIAFRLDDPAPFLRLAEWHLAQRL